MRVDTRDLVVLDVETTGPDPTIHQLLAATFVPVGRKVPPLSLYVRHRKAAWTETGRAYFSYYSALWKSGAESSSSAYGALGRYLEKHFSNRQISLVGHNVGFDLAFLKQLFRGRAFPSISHRTIDTHTMLRVLAWMGRVPEQACTSSGAFAHFGIQLPPGERHTSLGDALATRDLFLRLLNEFDLDSASIAGHTTRSAKSWGVPELTPRSGSLRKIGKGPHQMSTRTGSASSSKRPG